MTDKKFLSVDDIKIGDIICVCEDLVKTEWKFLILNRDFKTNSDLKLKTLLINENLIT